MTKGLKLCEKNDRSPCLFRRKQSPIDLANLSSKGTFLVRAVRTLMMQEIMPVRDAQCNTKESP